MPMRIKRLISLAICAVILCTGYVQAQGIPITALPNATTPLSSGDYFIVSQSGITRKATAAQVVVPGLTIANNTVLGNVSGATAAATALNVTQLSALLALGTAAYVNTGTSGHVLPFLDTSNTWSGLQTLTGGIAITGNISLTGNLVVSGTSSLGNGSASYLTVNGGALATTVATNAGGLTIAPFSAATSVTGSLAASTTMTVGTGLTVSAGGATITAGGATISAGGAAITGNTSVASGTFTASGGAFTASPANANDVLSPTGTGTVTISPATAGTIDNMAIGATTRGAGKFTTLDANSTVTLSPTGSVAINPSTTLSLAPTGVLTVNPTAASTMNNVAIGGSTPLAVTSTALTATGAVALSPASANVVLSPTGTGVVTINPATAGTMNNVAIGGSTPLAVTSTALTATGAVALSPASANVVLSPTGTGLVTINPATAGTLNNLVIGGSTPLAITGTTITASTAFRGTDFGSGSASTVNLTTTGGTQLQVTNTGSAARNVTVTGSAAGNPTISVTAGSLAITPATVFASTISATGITNTAGETFSGTTAPISLNGAAGTSGNYLTSAGAGATPTWSTGPAAYLTWAGAPKTTAFNAASNTAYCVDTLTTGAVTMTLPTSPSDGDNIKWIDCKGNFATANFTISRNGKLLMGLSADMTVSTNNASAVLTYSSTLGDWRLN